MDEGFVCHVGLVTAKGFPVVIPLAYGRDGDVVYLHGSAASRLFRGARTPDVEICMTVTFVDGLVVARSTYNTDINYRSVVVIGPASEVKDLEEKRIGLERMVDHIIPGRSGDARPPTEKELRSTMLLRLPLSESVGQGPHGLAARRGGGLRPPDLGRGHPAHDGGRTGPRRPRAAGRGHHPGLRRAVPAPGSHPVCDERERGLMCGVVGLLLRDPELEPRLGELLVPMIEALDERGPDSSGIALYADPPADAGVGRRDGPGAPPLRLSLGADVAVDWMTVGCALLDLCGTGADLQRFGAGLVVDLPEDALPDARPAAGDAMAAGAGARIGHQRPRS